MRQREAAGTAHPYLEVGEARHHGGDALRGSRDSRPRTRPTATRRRGAPGRAGTRSILRSSSIGEAGSRRPRDECTHDIESSTVTNCSPDAWTSRSVRPRQGRISDSVPGSTCERLSLVAMCTVSRQPRRAASVTGVSGVAAAKLPPRPRNTEARPSRMARIASTVSCPDARRHGEAQRLTQRGSPCRRVLHDAHGPVTLHVGVTTHRAQAGARAAEHAAQQLDVHDLADGGDRVSLLGQPHRPAHDRRGRVREQPRHERRSRRG